MMKLRTTVLMSFLFWGLALACSGGGGSSAPIPQPPPPPVAPPPGAQTSGNPPTGGNEMPTGGNEMPTGGNEMPTGGNEMPTGGNEMPTGGNEMPTGGNEMPSSEGGTFEEKRSFYRNDYEFRQPATEFFTLSAIKADAAYARGATGMGVTVGIMDHGFSNDHKEFDSEGKFHENSLFHDPKIMPTRYFNPLSHGTSTASILAGVRHTKVGTEPGKCLRAPDEDLHICESGYYMHGVAFNAQLLAYSVTSYDIAQDGIGSRLYQFMIDRVKIVSISLGSGQYISLLSEEEIRQRHPMIIKTLAQADTRKEDRTIFVRAAGNSPDTDIRGVNGYPAKIKELEGHHIVVVGVYSESTGPSQSTGGPIDSSSVRCGSVADWCLAAPFNNAAARTFYLDRVVLNGASRVPIEGSALFSRYSTVSGTSGSAPMVAGGLALMMEMFRDQLGTDALVKRMFATANKDGIYAQKEIYGQGLLDLDAATRPVGEAGLAVTTAFTGPRVAAELSSLTAAPAFGDAFVHGLAGLEIAALDELDAPFFFNFASFVQPALEAHTLANRLFEFGKDPRGEALRAPFALLGGETTLRARIASDGRARDEDDPASLRVASFSLAANFGEARGFFALNENTGFHFGLHAAGVLEAGQLADENAFTAPWLSLAGDGAALGLATPLAGGTVRVAAFTGDAAFAPARSDGALFEYAARGFSLQAGVVRETGRALGANAEGAFGALRGATVFTGTTSHWPLAENWRAFASAHFGYTRASAPRELSLVEGVTPLISTSFGLGLAHQNWLRAGDQLTVTLTQPLRVEHGSASLHWTTGRTRYKELTHARHALNLSPTGRQLDLAFTYARPLAHGQLTLASIATRHPGHRKSATPEYTLLLRYAREF